MPKNPPVAELEFIKLTRNHAEFKRILETLDIQSEDVLEYAKHVSQCWYDLAKEHLEDAKSALAHKRIRAAYSRAYYAAYNASKAARYLVAGSVSLKGDDHAQAATGLPTDVPNVEVWSQKITSLYECRQYADYDNWNVSVASPPLTPEQAAQTAEEFLNVVRNYVEQKVGLSL